MAVNIGPKIGIDGEADYRNQINKIITSTKTLSAEMKALTSSFDSENKSISQNKQQKQLLNQMIDQQKSKLEQLNSMLDKSAQKYGENDTKTQKWKQAVANAETELNKLQAELKALPNSLQLVGQKMTDLGNKMKSIGSSVSSLGSSLTMKVTAPIVAMATKVTASYAEVDKVMVLTNQTMGNTAEEAKILDQAMQSAAANSVYGMEDAANAALNFARAGLDASQAADTLAPAMNLAAGEGGTLDTVSAGLVATINGFGDSFDNAATYADVFAAACNNSALDVDSLSESMSVAAPIFSAAGYSVEDAALYMGVMANAGIDANVAATSLKTGFARLVSPAKEGAEAMAELGISITNADGSMKDSYTIQAELNKAFSTLSESEQIAAASAIFGKNQMSSWLALINTAPSDVYSLNQALENSAGTTEAMAEAMMGGFGGSIERLKSSLDVLGYQLGSIIANYVAPFVEKIQGLTDKFLSLDEQTQNTIVKIAGIAAAVGPILLIIGKLIIFIGSIVTSFGTLTTAIGAIGPALTAFGGFITATVIPAITGIATSALAAIPAIISFMAPFAPFILIAAAVVAAGVLIYKNWDTIKEYAAKLGDKIATVWSDIKSKTAEVWNNVKTAVSDAWNNIKTGVTNGINTVKNGITAGWNNVKSATSTVWGNVKTVVSNTMGNIKSNTVSSLSNIKSAYENAGGGIKGIVSAMFTAIKTIFQTQFNVLNTITGGLLGKIKDKFTALKDNALSWGKDMIDNFINGLKSKAGDLLNAVLSIIPEPIRAYCGFSEPDKGPLSDFHTYAPDMMKLYASGIKKNAYRVKDAISGVATDISVGLNGNNANQLAATSSLGSSIGALIDAGAVYEAIKEGMESANIGIELDGREFGRTLRGLGVSLS